MKLKGNAEYQSMISLATQLQPKGIKDPHDFLWTATPVVSSRMLTVRFLQAPHGVAALKAIMEQRVKSTGRSQYLYREISASLCEST